jgi:hypothetical protein
MRILVKEHDQNLILDANQNFKTDLGWSENAEILDREILYSIINPTENYETVRYIHSPYLSSGILQTDIWFYFYFYHNSTYTQDYRTQDITLEENSKLLNSASKSFFRLEFYKTPNDDKPTHFNRKMVFAKNLPFSTSERVFYTGNTSSGTLPFSDYIQLPVFNGSNFKNTENMYFFWFVDDTPFTDTSITGNTFYMTAKFYNAKDGSVTDFVNKNILATSQIVEENDVYYKVIINRNDFSYQVFNFNGSIGTRVGQTISPIIFYERKQ